MRKLVIIFFLFCYSATTIGLSFSLNYCEGNFSGISLDCSAIQCYCCDDEVDKDCCDGKVVKTDKADEHYRPFEKVLSVKAFSCLAAVFNAFPVFNLSQYTHEIVYNFHLRPPPLALNRVPIYILHSVFRI